MKAFEIIDKYVELAQQQNFKIVKGIYINVEKRKCCPLGAVAVPEYLEAYATCTASSENVIAIARRKLQRPALWLRGFSKGFDGFYSEPRALIELLGFRAGISYNEKFKTITEYEVDVNVY